MATDDAPPSRYGTCSECNSARYPVAQPYAGGIVILRLACRCWPPGVNELVADAAAAQVALE